MTLQLFLLAGGETRILGLMRDVVSKNAPYAFVFYIIILLFASCYVILGNQINGHRAPDGDPFENFGEHKKGGMELLEMFIWSY